MALQASEGLDPTDEGKIHGAMVLDIAAPAACLGFVKPELGFDGTEAAAPTRRL